MPRGERGDTERAERLDRYWDEVILGAPDPIPAAGPDPASAEVVRRLNTLTGAPASEEARRRVWQRLLDRDPVLARQAERTPLGDTGQGPTTPNGRVPTAATRPSPTRFTTVRRVWSLLEFAAAAALILGLLGLLGGYLGAPQALPRIAEIWRDPVAPAVPVARGGPARTGEQAGPGPAGVPDIRWQVQTGAVAPASPAVVDGVVYVGTHDRTLLALDATGGTERWRLVTDGAVGGAPAVADGAVYVGDEAGFLYAIDAASGALRWRADLGGSLYTSAPVVVDGVVYLTSGAGGTAPAVVDGVVYAGGDGSASRSPLLAHAVDAATGAERWRHNVGRNGIFALDATDGEERWRFATFAPVYHSSPAVAGGAVYVGSKDGHVYAVDAATGRERWRFKTGKAVYASPAVVAGTVYIGSTDGVFYAVDAATGQQRWRAEAGIVRRSSAAVAEGAVYVVGGNVLLALDAISGNERWRVTTGGAGEGSPVVIDGAVYVGGRISTVGDAQPTGAGVLIALSAGSEP